MASSGRRPFFSIFRVGIVGPYLAFVALLFGALPLLHIGWDRQDWRWALVLGPILILPGALFRCPQCWGGLGGRREYRTGCRRCGLDFERNTYWTRPFTNPDRRKVQ